MERPISLSARDRRIAFLTGAVSAFDLSGRLIMGKRYRNLSRVSDVQVLRSDWDAIGNDMRRVIEKVKPNR